MISQYRAWLPHQPEPANFPITQTSPQAAARAFLCDHHGVSLNQPFVEKLHIAIALQETPQLVLVREEDCPRTSPHRILVTAAVDISIWGYPEPTETEATP